MVNTSVYLLAAGTLSANTLQTNDNYIIANFPTGSDQSVASGQDWQATLADVVKDPPRIRALNKTVGYFGTNSGELMLKIATREMLTYLWENIFSSVPSAAVTLQVPHQRDGWQVYNATLEWCTLPEGGELGRPYVANVKFPFSGATVAVAGRAFTLGFTRGFS